MNKKTLLLGCVVWLVSCKNTPVTPTTYFDSLLVTQIKNLSYVKAGITKTAKIDERSEEVHFVPDSLKWENELDVFRQLNAFSKPSYSGEYVVRDKLKDPKSNLLVRSYRSARNVPVPSIKFFYHRQLRDLKKIEAVYEERNMLYFTSRRLIMEFEDIHGSPVLAGYFVDGVQKMVFSDSVHFSIRSVVDLTKLN